MNYRPTNQPRGTVSNHQVKFADILGIDLFEYRNENNPKNEDNVKWNTTSKRNGSNKVSSQSFKVKAKLSLALPRTGIFQVLHVLCAGDILLNCEIHLIHRFYTCEIHLIHRFCTCEIHLIHRYCKVF